MTDDQKLVNEIRLRINATEAEIKGDVEWLKEYLNNEVMPLEEKVKSIIATGDNLKSSHTKLLELTNIQKRTKKWHLK